MGMVNTQSRLISLWATQPLSPQKVVKRLPSRLVWCSSPALAELAHQEASFLLLPSETQKPQMFYWWIALWQSAKQMLEVAHGSQTLPQSLTWCSAMQQWSPLLAKTTPSCRKAPVAPEQDVLWSQNGPGTCQIPITSCFHKELKKVQLQLV